MVWCWRKLYRSRGISSEDNVSTSDYIAAIEELLDAKQVSTYADRALKPVTKFYADWRKAFAGKGIGFHRFVPRTHGAVSASWDVLARQFQQQLAGKTLREFREFDYCCKCGNTVYDHVVIRNVDIENELAALNCAKRLMDAPLESTLWLEISELDSKISDEATPETAASAAEVTSSTLQGNIRDENDLVYLSARVKRSGPKPDWSNGWNVTYSRRLRKQSMNCDMQLSTLIDSLESDVRRHRRGEPVTHSVISTFLLSLCNLSHISAKLSGHWRVFPVKEDFRHTSIRRGVHSNLRLKICTVCSTREIPQLGSTTCYKVH